MRITKLTGYIVQLVILLRVNSFFVNIFHGTSKDEDIIIFLHGINFVPKSC